MSPFVLRPTPDGAGTAALTVPAGVRDAVVGHAGLVALDLDASPELEALDLRGCASGLRLTLRAHANLRRIRLPDGPSVVFLERFGLGPLTLEGRVKRLDLAWTNADGAHRGLEVCARKHESLAGVHLGAADEPPPPDVEAWVVVGGHLPRSGLAGCTTPRLWLVDVRAPEGLAFDAPLASLMLEHVDTPSLQFQTADRVRARACGALASVRGHTPHLMLRGGARLDELELDGRMKEVLLYDMHCRSVRALGCTRLQLGRAEDIAEVHMLGAGEPMTVHCDGVSPAIRGTPWTTVRVGSPREIDHQFFEGTQAGRVAMFGWATDCTRTGDLENALRVFCSAVDSEHVTSTVAWEARARLYRRHDTRGPWDWPFPEDQALVGFAVDVRLWLRLRVDAPDEARAASTVFTRTGAPSNVAALLYVATARDLDDDERDDVLELARLALVHGAALGERLDLPHRLLHGPVSLSREVISYLDTALACLLANAGHPRAQALGAAFAGWIAARAPTEDGVRVLGKLYAHGCADAARVLERMRRGMSHRHELDAEARERLLLAIARQHLLPPEQPRFAA